MQIGDVQKPFVPAFAPSAEAHLEGARRAAERGDSAETARQFETVFGVMLVRELRRAMPKSLFGEGAGTDVYEGWFDEHLGRALAENDALGIAGLVKVALQRGEAAGGGDRP